MSNKGVEQSGEISQWWAYYQWGLPCLVVEQSRLHRVCKKLDRFRRQIKLNFYSQHIIKKNNLDQEINLTFNRLSVALAVLKTM